MSPDQPVPVVVADLVAEMAEQRAVGLAHLGAPLFALGVVGLGDIERDQALVVAGQDAFATRPAADRIGEEVESKANLVRRVLLGRYRQAESE